LQLQAIHLFARHVYQASDSSIAKVPLTRATSVALVKHIICRN